MTRTVKRGLLVFAFRITVFIGVFILYITSRDYLDGLMGRPFFDGLINGEINPVHLLWLIFMIMLLHHVFPNKGCTLALRKRRDEGFEPADDYDRAGLADFVKTMNKRALSVTLVWLAGNAVFAALFFKGIINRADMLMLTMFYYISDYICILFFCPFQKIFMKSRCCINCRIYDWGHIMMFTPMLFIRSFFSWSLFLTALTVLILWEVSWARRPERFWSGSNRKLKCENCTEKLCHIKRKTSDRILDRLGFGG